MKTIIHINKNLKQSNDKHGRTLPVCRVEAEGKVWYGSKVDILGPSSMIYSPDKPRKDKASISHVSSLNPNNIRNAGQL